jgi:hypothetical protein
MFFDPCGTILSPAPHTFVKLSASISYKFALGHGISICSNLFTLSHTFLHNQLGELFFIKVPTRSVMSRGINAGSGLFNQ